MTKTREARRDAERRRLARRRAEVRGEPVPDWAALRPGESAEADRRDRTAEVLRMSGTARAALALARQAGAGAEGLDLAETRPGHVPAPVPEAEADPRPVWEPRSTPDPYAERMAAESLARGAATLTRVLAVPCPRHDAAPGLACWEWSDSRAVCAARTRRADPTTARRPQGRGRWSS